MSYFLLPPRTGLEKRKVGERLSRLGRREGGGERKERREGRGGRERKEVVGVKVLARLSKEEWEGGTVGEGSTGCGEGVPPCRLRQSPSWAQDPAPEHAKNSFAFPQAGTETHLPFYGKKNPDLRREPCSG